MENVEIVMITLNGLPRSWDSFIQGICARKKLVKFSRLWEECSQEEEKMGSEDQSLIVHSKKIRQDYHHPKGKHFHQNNSRKTQLRCFTCDEIGHYAKNFPINKRNSHKKKDKIK